MKYNIEEIYPGTAFRLVFFIILIIFGFLSFIYLLISVFIHQLLLGLLIFAIGVPLLALLGGFAAYIQAIIYTIFAKKFGGISVELKKQEDL